jgi:hypothetical protein
MGDQSTQPKMTRIRVSGVDVTSLGEALCAWYSSQGLEAITVANPSGLMVQCRSRKKLKLASGTGAELTVILHNEGQELVVEIGLAKWSAKAAKGAAAVGAAGGAVGGLLVGAAAGAAVGVGVVQWRRSKLPRQTIRFLRETAPSHIRRT